MKEFMLVRKPSYEVTNNTVKWSGDKLALKNDGQLELCFIGCGSAFAKTMYQNNVIIVKGGTHIMVDFGASGAIALDASCGLDMNDIECVLPTHSHSDHVGGIEALGQMNKYVGIPFMKKPKLKMIITEEYQRILWDYTLRGGLEYNEEIVKGKKMQFSDYYDAIHPKWSTFSPREIHTIDFNLHDTGLEKDTIRLEIFRTNHIPEQSKNWEASFVSYGLFIDNKVLYTSDSKLDIDMLELYQDKAAVIFQDLQFFPGAVHCPMPDYQERVHANVQRKTVGMHLADNFVDQDFGMLAGPARQGCRYIID